MEESMKQITHRKLIIPPNVQPFSDYQLTIDKGTEELTIITTRVSPGFNFYLSLNTPGGSIGDYQNNLGVSQLFSNIAHTIRDVSLFHPGLQMKIFFDPVQTQQITIDYISVVNISKYLYN